MADADSPDDESPQPTAHARDRLPSNPMARRSFMRRTAITTAAAIGAASSGAAAADDDDDSSNMDYVRDGTNGVYMLLTGRYFTRAWGNYQDAQDAYLHEQMYSTAREIEEDRTNAFDSIDESVMMLSGWIRDNATNEMAEVSQQTDPTLEDMHDAVEEVVRDNVANTEQNLFNFWVTDFEETAKAGHEVDQSGYEPDPHMFLGGIAHLDGGITGDSLTDHHRFDNLSYWTYLHTGGDEGEIGNTEAVQASFSLANGDQITIPVLMHLRNGQGFGLYPFAGAPNLDYENNHSDDPWYPAFGDEFIEDNADKHVLQNEYTESEYHEYLEDPDFLHEDHGALVRVSIYPYDAIEDDRADLLNAQRFTSVHRELLDLLEEELTWAENAVDHFGQALIDGEISAHDVASGQAVLDASTDMETWIHAANFFRAVNWPEGEHPVVLETESGIEFEGALFWTSPDPDNGLPVGEEIDPDDELGEIHLGAEVRSLDDYDGGDDDGDDDENDGHEDSDDLGDIDEDWAGPLQMTEPFTITGLEDGESGPLMFDETELPDPQDTEAMLERIRDAYEREEEARQAAETDTSVNVDVENPIGAGAGLFDGLGDNFGYFGLGLIGVTVLAVVGFVMDLIPGLGD